MVRLKFQQKCLCVFWPSCLFVCLIFCLLSLWPFLPLCFLLSTYVFFCGVFVYLLALFVPFVFSPFWVLSLRVLIMSEISELAPMYMIRPMQCIVQSVYFPMWVHISWYWEREKERGRETELEAPLGAPSNCGPFLPRVNFRQQFLHFQGTSTSQNHVKLNSQDRCAFDNVW